MTRIRTGKKKTGEPGAADRDPIPHSKILEAFDRGIGSRGIVELYRSEVLPVKTRTIHLLGRKSTARVIHTLLGYEVQASYKRIHCPDMATARYLKLFSEIGCRSIKLPYDPTVTERLLPGLESSLEGITRGVRSLFPDDRGTRTYVLKRVYMLIRSRLKAEQAAFSARAETNPPEPET